MASAGWSWPKPGLLNNARRIYAPPQLAQRVRLALALELLLLMLCLLVLIIGVLVVAIPGKVPLGIELVLQPSLAVIKFLAVTMAEFLLRSLSTFLLSH